MLHNGTPLTEEVEHANGNGGSQEERFSDSEEEQHEQADGDVEPEVESAPFIPPNIPITVADPIISTPEPLTAIRKRITERPPSSLSALPLVDRQVS